MSEAPGAAVPALSLRGIARGYGEGARRISVLEGLDFSVAPGEAVALVAPSGAGKSTLLQIAGLLDTPDAGAIDVAGEPVSTLDDAGRTAARRRLIGFVYQFHHLLPEFSAEENVSLPQLAAGAGRAAARARSEGLLERVGLAARAGHRPGELSGGEQQRVAICRALANRPRLLLADEPTGNLDPETSERVFGVLIALVRETGLAALVATHNHALAARMDRTVRLEGGRIV
ncbi:MAG: ABC transporter ATP-binding protein [Pseudomonadota bacterium]